VLKYQVGPIPHTVREDRDLSVHRGWAVLCNRTEGRSVHIGMETGSSWNGHVQGVR